MLSFCLKGTELRLDFSFFAVTALFLAYDASSFGMMSVVACALHELGHLLVLLHRKKPPRALTLYGGGIKLTAGKMNDFALLSAGCLINLLLFLLSLLCKPLLPFGYVNLLVCCFNLVPAGYFDGRGLLELTLIRLLPPEKAIGAVEAVGLITAVAAAATAITLTICGVVNFTAAITFIYLLAVEITEKM